MSDALAQLVDGRENSALTDIFTEAPRLVDPVAEALPSAPLENPLQSLSQLLRPTTKPTLPTPSATSPDVDDDEFIPLTAAEIKSMAEAKAETWAAIIALVFGFIHRYAAYEKIREGDRKLIKDFELETKLTGNMPVYPAEHPYHAARERWQDFEDAMEEADEEASLSDGQRLSLQEAFKAELSAKNKRGQLKSGSSTSVLIGILLTKAIVPLALGSQAWMSKRVDKSMR